MSSILDALRKLEKEKTERGDGLSTAVAGDILRVEHCRQRRRWLLPLLWGAILLLTGAAFWLLWQPATPEQELPPAGKSPAPLTASLPADLPLLSGIVYQNQRDARIAILNDLPTMEGADIAGYLLVEIHPDHVVLARAGQHYDLPLAPAP